MSARVSVAFVLRVEAGLAWRGCLAEKDAPDAEKIGSNVCDGPVSRISEVGEVSAMVLH